MQQMSNIRKSENLYIEAYKMMNFFEEAVERIKIRQYNRSGLILYNTNIKKEFYFLVEVSVFSSRY